MPSYDFAFAIGQQVRVLAINAPGRVAEVAANTNIRTYMVIWWIAGERKEAWLHEWEIEPA